MSIFKCPNCNNGELPKDESPCWKCGSSKTVSEMDTVPMKREVIGDQLLTALNDKSKVTILANKEDLQLLMMGLNNLTLIDSKLNKKRVQYAKDLKQLFDASFNV